MNIIFLICLLIGAIALFIFSTYKALNVPVIGRTEEDKENLFIWTVFAFLSIAAIIVSLVLLPLDIGLFLERVSL